MNHNKTNWLKFKQELAKVNAEYTIKQYDAIQKLVRSYADNPSNLTLLVDVLNAIARLPIAFDIIGISEFGGANELNSHTFFDTSKWTEKEIANVLYAEGNHMQKARDIEKEKENK